MQMRYKALQTSQPLLSLYLSIEVSLSHNIRFIAKFLARIDIGLEFLHSYKRIEDKRFFYLLEQLVDFFSVSMVIYDEDDFEQSSYLFDIAQQTPIAMSIKYFIYSACRYNYIL